MHTNETRKRSTMHPILDSEPRNQWLATVLLLTTVGVNLIECHFSPWIHTPTTHPCIFEDHLVTDKNWHGYLANITVMTTGRLSFEFSYPVDKCCQNILFYSEDQMSIINARMNCWQKEYLLRPEEDQILRLTPKFSWSGCHMTHPNDIATYVCKGGRSFTVEQQGDRPTTWYIAASNCATLQGLDLHYRMEIFGHIGECRSSFQDQLQPITVGPPLVHPSVKAALTAREDNAAAAAAGGYSSDASGPPICIVEGYVNTTSNWHGFIANISLNAGGGFRFRFNLPYHFQTQNVILYTEEDLARLGWDRTCWQKEGVISSQHVPDQVLDLSFRASWNGCVSNNSTHSRNLTCHGERRYNSPRKIFAAVNNCRSQQGLLLNYRFEVFGFDSTDMCSVASLPGLCGATPQLLSLAAAILLV